MSDNRTPMEQVADWLVDTGYPFDYHFDSPPPKKLLVELAHAWCKKEADPELTPDDYLDVFDIELGWSPS